MLLTLNLRVKQLCLYSQELFNNDPQGSYKTAQAHSIWLEVSLRIIHFTYWRYKKGRSVIQKYLRLSSNILSRERAFGFLSAHAFFVLVLGEHLREIS
jgi:hypothetical protein